MKPLWVAVVTADRSSADDALVDVVGVFPNKELAKRAVETHSGEGLWTNDGVLYDDLAVEVRGSVHEV